MSRTPYSRSAASCGSAMCQVSPLQLRTGSSATSCVGWPACKELPSILLVFGFSRRTLCCKQLHPHVTETECATDGATCRSASVNSTSDTAVAAEE